MKIEKEMVTSSFDSGFAKASVFIGRKKGRIDGIEGSNL